MRHWMTGAIILCLVGFLSFLSAQNKVNDYSLVESLRVGTPVTELGFLGHPLSMNQKERIYQLPDYSSLVIHSDGEKVTGAWLQLKQPMRIDDPTIKQVQFVQLEMDNALVPTWFYAGAADEGRIYRVSEQGLIESISWVKPFNALGPKQKLQALLKEFTYKKSYSL